tara:strand:- start:2565 stop:2762 length:198 start_codon:yes stop_codon:yes gene_type:complete
MYKKKTITLDEDMEGKINNFMKNKNKITEKIFDNQPAPKKKAVSKPKPKQKVISDKPKSNNKKKK